MSKLTESLEQQMKLIYGDSFGKDIKAADLTEAVESAFLESSRFLNRGRKFSSVKSGGSEVRQAQAPVSPRKTDPRSRFLNRGGKFGSVKSGGSEVKSAPKRKFGGNIRGVNHNPFQRHHDLGPGPRNSKHVERKCWSCKCGDIYDRGCECTGTGASKTCPEGHKKHITIKKDYHRAYNDEYHAWRGQPSNSQRIASRGKTK